MEIKEVDKGHTFKIDPIKEIKELNALGKYAVSNTHLTLQTRELV